MTKHKHAEIIIAWANGAEIEWFQKDVGWSPIDEPTWYKDREYRVKPKTMYIKLHAAIPVGGGKLEFGYGDGSDHSHKGYIRLPHLDCEVEVLCV